MQTFEWHNGMQQGISRANACQKPLLKRSYIIKYRESSDDRFRWKHWVRQSWSEFLKNDIIYRNPTENQGGAFTNMV